MKEHHAVLVRDHPDVPPADARRARPVTKNGVVVGYSVPAKLRHFPLPRLQGRISIRFTHVLELIAWRRRNGVKTDAGGLLIVVANCLCILNGFRHWRCDRDYAQQLLNHAEIDVSDTDIDDALNRRSRQGRALSNSDVGKLLGLTTGELLELQAEGVVLAMHPIDETPGQRDERRALRRSEMNRKRQARRRQRKKHVAAKSVTGGAILQNGVTLPSYIRERDANIATLCEPDRVIAAVAAGAATPAAIAAATDLPLSTVRPLLSRLGGAGMIAKVSRGRYALPTSMEGQDHVEH